VFRLSETAIATDVIFVNASILGSGDGSSWANACKTIQEGINAAISAGVLDVWVAEGTYEENITLEGGVSIYGGLQVGASSLEQRIIASSFIDGQNLATAVAVNKGSHSTIDGFTIQNGMGSHNGYTELNGLATNGGGIYASEADVRIVNNHIIHNNGGLGGGIYIDYTSTAANISNNIIEENTANLSGAGIFIHEASPIIERNTIKDNLAEHAGGGIFCDWSFSTISKNIIQNNIASEKRGGGIYFNKCDLILANNLITGNCANTGGGGVYGVEAYNPVIYNNTIVANNSIFNAIGLMFDNSNPDIKNCIVWEEYAPAISGCVAHYSNISDAVGQGTGNISENPMFVDDVSFQLSCDSPCRDMGINVEAIVTDDIDGQPRPLPDVFTSQVANFDMGYDEFFENIPPTVNAGADQTVDFYDAITIDAEATDNCDDLLTFEWREGDIVLGSDNPLIIDDY